MIDAMRILDPWAPADSLGAALHTLRMNGAFYCRSELRAPWGMSLPPMPGYLWFHVVTSGSAWLELTPGEHVPMQRGDLMLVSHGTGHGLRSAPTTLAPDIMALPREQLSDRYETLQIDGGGEGTTMICGAVRFDAPEAGNLVQALPELIRVEAAESSETGWMPGTLALMAAEARSPRPGGEAVITRLADILVIQAIRSWLETDEAARRGWLGALQDPQVGRAISLIHDRPADDWTVAELARQVAMSRSAFAARFTDLVGEPAMQYVTRWRMHLAHSALRDGNATVAELAGRLGYRSEAAFARAFKRTTGAPPGSVRRAEQHSTPATTGSRAPSVADPVRDVM